MPSRKEKVSNFYTKTLDTIGLFAIAPVFYGCIEPAVDIGCDEPIFNRETPVTREYGLLACCVCCPCIYAPAVLTGEVVTLTLALIGILSLGVAAPFVYGGAAALDSCRPQPAGEETPVIN